MCTKEEIKAAKDYLSDQGYGTGSNFTVNAVANLMAEWKETKKVKYNIETLLDLNNKTIPVHFVVSKGDVTINITDDDLIL